MHENILHYVWQNMLFDKKLKTVDGQDITVIHPGFPSNQQGPDFENAKIKINNRTWYGTVEIHVNASDWYRHGHNTDKNYDNVILHVVHKFDKPVYRTNGEPIPTLELKIPEKIQQNFNRIYQSKDTIKCTNLSQKIPQLYKLNWLENLLLQRLQQRTNSILSLLHYTKNHWEQVLFIQIARYFGQKVNNQPFELLAKSLPLTTLYRNSDDKEQTEALLFGQAGLLQHKCNDEYFLKLKNDFEFLKLKYNLKPLEPSIWRFSKIYPHNFPTIRISQLADFITKNQPLFDLLLEITDLEEFYALFKFCASPYWDNHYKFCKPGRKKYKKCLSKQAIQNLLINAVLPFIFAYGHYFSEKQFMQRALEFYSKLPFEQNSITKKFQAMEFPAESAAHSQAQLQLYHNYCQQNLCFKCRIGSWILVNE